VLYQLDAVLAPAAELVAAAATVPQFEAFVGALEATGLAVRGRGEVPGGARRCCGQQRPCSVLCVRLAQKAHSQAATQSVQAASRPSSTQSAATARAARPAMQNCPASGWPRAAGGFTSLAAFQCCLRGPKLQLFTPQRDADSSALPAAAQGQLSAGCPDPTTADCPYNPITVFAPTNAAFLDLAASLNTSLNGLFRQDCCW
jgi:hypothetical protein